MIHYEHPKQTKRFGLARLKFWTEDILEYEDNPSARVHAHYNAILKNQNGKLGPDFNGAAFEVVLNDAVLFYAPTTDILYGFDPTPMKLNADIDLYLPSQNIALLCKTSLRERWKQIDRDARLIADSTGASVYGLFLCEKSTTGASPHCLPRRICLDSCAGKMMKLAAAKSVLLSAKNTKIVTVLDENQMQEIFGML